MWLERVHAGNWTGDDQRALEAWLAQSHHHRAAYWRLEAAWSDASRLVALGPSRFRKLVPSRKSFAIALRLVAAIAILSVVGVIGTRYMRKQPMETYSTTIGGRELVRFADGTEIELNTDTVLRTRMTTQERTVWLDRGEAYFQVRHDPAHPFAVMVGNRRVTDLGTEFVVHRDGAETRVAVVQGRVRLDSPNAPAPAKTAMLLPGDVATASPASLSVTKESQEALANLLAWRRGELVFHHTALGEAVAEFNRYNTTKLAVSDPAVANMPVGGVFRTDNLDDFTRAVQVVLGLHIRRESGTIVIAR